MNVRWSHVVIYILGGICGWLMFFAWNREHIKEVHLETLRTSLLHHARLAEVLFNLSDSMRDAEIDSIRRKIPYHISIIDRRGEIVADSLLSGPLLRQAGNQRQQKEIVEAAREGAGTEVRFSPITRGWFLYAAVPLSGQGFVRLAAPVSGREPLPEAE